MSTITGFMTDAGLTPFQGRYPDLFLKLERPTTRGVHLLTREPVAAVITDTTGAFVFTDVVPTDEMIPIGSYTLRARWDVGRELDVITGLRVPPGDHNLSDLVLATGASIIPTMPMGFGPPPPTLTGNYYDLSTGLIWGNPEEVL